MAQPSLCTCIRKRLYTFARQLASPFSDSRRRRFVLGQPLRRALSTSTVRPQLAAGGSLMSIACLRSIFMVSVSRNAP
jgi:hypothetical protein